MAWGTIVLKYVCITCFSCIMLVGVVGNLLVLYAFLFVKKLATAGCRSKHSLTPMELVICYLAFIDLLTSIFNPIIYIYFELTHYTSWGFGPELCILGPGLMSVFSTMSFGMILVITIERCISISFPFRKKLQKKEIHLAVFGVLVLSILNELPYLLTLTVQQQIQIPSMYQCQFTLNSTVSAAKNCTTTPGVCFTNDYYGVFTKDPIFNITDENPQPHSCSTLSVTRNISGTRCCKDNLTIVYLNDTLIQASCHLQRLCKMTENCSPSRSVSYRYQRIGTILLRDFVFLLVFTGSTLIIYRELRNCKSLLKGQGAVDPNQCLRIMVTMAVVFAVLVLPKDIFHVTYVLRYTVGNPIDYKVAHVTNTILKIIQSLTSIANVFIYAKLHTKFKTNIMHISSALSIGMNSKSVYDKDQRDPILSSSIKEALSSMKETDV